MYGDKLTWHLSLYIDKSIKQTVFQYFVYGIVYNHVKGFNDVCDYIAIIPQSDITVEASVLLYVILLMTLSR